MSRYAPRKNPRFGWLSLGILVLIALPGIAYLGYQAATLPPMLATTTSRSDSPALQIGGKFTLIDQKNQIRHSEEFRGRFMLIYFGYTYCPDICPLDLRDMALALDELELSHEDVALIFISIDPERDTPERLAAFAEALDPGLIALTGSPDQIARVARDYRVYYAKAASSQPHLEDYLMNHSALFYVMGPKGQYLTHIAHGVSRQQMKSILNNTITPASR